MNTTLEPQNIPHVPACNTTDKTTTSKVVKLVRRIKQSIKPTHCKVRWDSMVNKWAIMDGPLDKLQLVRHFEYGYMTNVKFYPMNTTIPSICVYSQTIGIAEGDLVENDHGSEVTGFVNIGFNGQQFEDASHNPITEAKYLRLMSGRTALVRL
jgi:hypothetical protein